MYSDRLNRRPSVVDDGDVANSLSFESVEMVRVRAELILFKRAQQRRLTA